MIKVIAFILFLSSCATTESGEWKEVTVSTDLMHWRWCDLSHDGEAYADKGWCWIGKECKSRVLRSDECRPKPYFCAFSDVECMRKHQIDRKTLVKVSR